MANTVKSPACCRCGRVWQGNTDFAVVDFIMEDGSSFAGCTDCLAEFGKNKKADFNEFWHKQQPQAACADCEITFSNADEISNMFGGN